MIITLSQVSSALCSHSPQAISSREYPAYQRAAVLIPLFLTDEGLCLLLTVRTNEVETHKGQISFPGGMKETSDPDAIATALREANEELGIHTEDVSILGLLGDVPVPTGFLITPVVGLLSNLTNLKPHAQEVAEVLTIPLSFFSESSNATWQTRTLGNRQFKVWYFRYNNHLIWGATAGMIVRLLDLVSTGETR